MTNIYESELLHKLMERDGLNIPSSVPPYESEIKAYLIEQVKFAYPKLIDYEAEWLLYNYTNHLPAEFPIETITNVNNATVDNVVPYAYKSAILTGQTLVNLVKQNEAKTVYTTREAITNGFRYTQQYNNTSMGATRIQWNKETGVNLFKPSTEYYIQCDIKVNKPRVLRVYSPGSNTQFSYEFLENESTHIKGTFVTATNSFDYIYFYVAPLEGSNMEDYVDDTFEITNLIIMEYQEGMENWDISYFEGMQSVKMPVLTTSNEDDTKSNILTVNEEVELHGIGDVRDTLDLISGEIIVSIGENVLNGREEWVFNAPKEQPNHWCFHNAQKLADEKLLISDRITQSDIDGDRESIRGGGDFIFVYISKEKVEGNVNSFKQWLSQNPIKYQYRKSEKSVKTVELSITDESGNKIKHFIPIEGTMHIQTDGEPVKPSVTMEIPVEAITQNLASFIEMEV